MDWRVYFAVGRVVFLFLLRRAFRQRTVAFAAGPHDRHWRGGAEKEPHLCLAERDLLFFSFAKETSAENKLAGPASVAQSRLVPRQLPRETFRLCIERSEEPKKTWNQLSQCLHKRLLLFHLSFVSVSLCMRGKDSGNLQRQPTTSATPPKRRSSEENVKKDVLWTVSETLPLPFESCALTVSSLGSVAITFHNIVSEPSKTQ